MKICIVSDSHDRAPMLRDAVAQARQAGAEAVVHCGDVIGAMTLQPLLELGLPLHFIHGNNLGDAAAPQLGAGELAAAGAEHAQGDR